MARKIRGVSMRRYAELMHQIERGEITEQELVRQGELQPSKRDDNRGIAKFRDNQVFKKTSNVRGRRRNDDECLVPHCNNKESRRGLCNTHRTYAYLLIRKGKATEEDLIKRRLMLRKASGGDQRKYQRKAKKTGTKKLPVKKKTPKKKTIKKKVAQSRRHKSKRSSKAPIVVAIESIPEKFIEADRCLYPKCKRNRRGGGRGLCVKHYSQYKRKRSKLPAEQRKTLDRDLIKRRLLLPPRATIKKQQQEAESSAFEIGSTIRGSIRRW